MLSGYSSHWKEIGIHLGFHMSELDQIEAQPLLLSNAPSSYLRMMLSHWLQWGPGDERGSSGFATMETLCNALKKLAYLQ